ncbi:DNA transfer protein p32 [Cupriavidus oxalaticus]|uniref:hypothetical protein n=1 Tax=Cupriavidus oxalaticus TaxID=96344 RepID=UPI003F735BF2
MSFGVTAAVVGGAAALGGAALSASASRKAARASGDAATQAAQLQYDQYEQTREDQAPWRTAGNNALNELALRLGTTQHVMGADLPKTRENFDSAAYLRANPDVASGWAGGDAFDHYDMYGRNEGRQFTYAPEAFTKQDAINKQIDAARASGTYGSLLRNFTTSDFEADPGYQFRLGEGQKQIESSAAARGGLLSGAAAKALTKYNQNFASNEFQNAYNRFNTNQGNTFNRLASLAGVGQTATNQLQAAGQNYANNAGQAAIYGGTQRASGYAGQANALSAGLGGVASAIGNIPFGSFAGNNPYGTYTAQTSPVTDYYAGVQGRPLA